MARKKILSLALTAMLSVSSVWEASPAFYEGMIAKAVAETKTDNKDGETELISEAENVNAEAYPLCENSKDGVILHAFCWSFNTIKENMKDIAEAGYTTVQTSPINQCLVGDGGGMELMGNGKWWYHYQPTDWKIGNYQLGSRDEYIAMCDEAEKYGVKIISDVLPNHTTPDLGAVSQELKNAAGGQENLYHANGFHEITQWTNRYECTTGQMGGLPDVNTENKGFQEYYLKFCNDVIACGGDGFRYDTAKHIGVPSDPKDAKSQENDFWPIASGQKEVNGVKLSNPDKLFIYGEILMDAGIPYEEYGNYINMTNSGYGGKLRGIIGGKNLNAGDLANWGHPIPEKTVTWVESHDTYCNDGESVWMTNEQIRACWAIIAARKEGTPLFMSRPMGSTNTKDGRWGNNKIGAAGNDEYKHPEVVAVNRFRTAMVGEDEALNNFGGNDCLVIERGDRGAVIINQGSQKSNVTLSKVADGTYTEQVTGTQVEVSGGVLNYTVPAGSIAVVYNAGPVVKQPKVSVSKDSGNITDAFELTLTPVNATKAAYSINGGQAVDFTKATKIMIGENAQVGDEITVKVTAEGEEGEPFSKTFTYTMVDTPDLPKAKVYICAKKSDFTSAPSIYVYSGNPVKELTGEFPGQKMTEEGDYYVYYTNEVDSAKVIFSYDDIQDPAHQEPGYDVTGYMEYEKGKGVSKYTPAPKKTAAPTPAITQTPVPVPVQTPTASAIVETPTPEPVKSWVSVSKEDGSSFTSETMEVEVTLNGVTEGTYSVDNGPEKSFKSGDSITIGQGKIADTDVTLKISATIDKTDRTKIFTYKKVFDKNTTQVKVSAVTKLQSLFKAADVAVTNVEVLSGEPASGYFQTNPNKQTGSKKTIKSASDFTEDMIIAQGVANDNITIFKGEHEGLIYDSYALFGAYDDSNIYLGIQYTNVIDITAPYQEFPQSEHGKPWYDLPQMFVFDTGSGDYTDGSTNSENEKNLWDVKVKYAKDAKVDNILMYSGDATKKSMAWYKVSGGKIDTESVTTIKADIGITYKYEDGFFCSHMYGINKNGNDGYTPTELNSDRSNWIDFLTTKHDTKKDTFMTMTIPLERLGMTAKDVEEKGIGVMSISGRGESAVASLPQDFSMLDNVLKEFTLDDTTSAEKEDTDTVTVPLARLGGTVADNGKNTPEPITTPEVSVSPTLPPYPIVTPFSTPVVSGGVVTSTPTPQPGQFLVNFGADRSSPQYDSTVLTLKAVAYGSKDYKYEFYVDGKVIQKMSEKDSCIWKGTAKSHVIKVVVTDGEGKCVSVEKRYVLEPDMSVTPTPLPVSTAVADTQAKVTPTPIVSTDAPKQEITSSPVITNVPEKTAEPQEETNTENEALKGSIKITKKSPQKAGTTIPISIIAKGGKAPYTYTLKVKDSSGKSTAFLSNVAENTVKWKPSKAGTYKITWKVTDAEGKSVSENESYKISNPIQVKTFKLGNSTVKKGKKITITAKASSAYTVKYQFRLRKTSAKKYTTIRKYSKNGTYKWKADKKGKYYIYLDVKDAKGNTKSVKKKITIK